jgi:superfamily II RNA helicase
MDISGAQLNSAAINAYNTQLQETPRQNNRQAAPAPLSQQAPGTEVSLSADARDRAAQNDLSPPVQPASSSQDSSATESSLAQQASGRQQERSVEDRASQAREADARRQQTQSSQLEASASTYAARVAVQNYSRIADF